MQNLVQLTMDRRRNTTESVQSRGATKISRESLQSAALNALQNAPRPLRMGETCEGAGTASCNWMYLARPGNRTAFLCLLLSEPSRIELLLQSATPTCCHLQYLQHQHHHLLHANCHSFGNYFRTRTPIMYLAPLKAASASK